MFQEHVYYRSYMGTGYVLDQNSGRSYYFEETAALILEQLASGETDELRIAERIAQIYDIPSVEEVWQDTISFIRQLREAGILVQEPEVFQNRLPEDYLTDYCWANHKLDTVSLELTYRCNERCLHCYTCDAEKNPRRELSTQEYGRIMDELRDFRVEELVLSGGEIGLRSDFSSIYKYAIKKGFRVTLMTNGTLFTPEQMEMFYQDPPKIVYVSFYGGSPHTHDQVTGVPGSFARSLDTVMRLKCAGIAVGLKTVAMTLTMKDYPNIVKLAERLDVGLGTGMYLTCGNNGSKTPIRYRLTESHDYERIVEIKQKYQKAYTPYRSRDLNGPICEAGIMACTINPYGDYYVCTSLPVACGNVREMSIAEFWNDAPLLKKIRSLRFRDTGCTDCTYKNECVYCVGANYVETGGLFAVQEGHCLAAKAFYKYFREQCIIKK